MSKFRRLDLGETNLNPYMPVGLAQGNYSVESGPDQIDQKDCKEQTVNLHSADGDSLYTKNGDTIGHDGSSERNRQ